MTNNFLNETSYKDYSNRKIGEGLFSKVYLRSISEKFIAVKEIDLKIIRDQDKKNEVRKKIQTEYQIHHKGLSNVVKSYELFYDEINEVCTFSMDYFEYNLEEFLKKEGPISFQVFISLFNDIITGEAYYICKINIIIYFFYLLFQDCIISGGKEMLSKST